MTPVLEIAIIGIFIFLVALSIYLQQRVNASTEDRQEKKEDWQSLTYFPPKEPEIPCRHLHCDIHEDVYIPDDEFSGTQYYILTCPECGYKTKFSEPIYRPEFHSFDAIRDAIGDILGNEYIVLYNSKRWKRQWYTEMPANISRIIRDGNDYQEMLRRIIYNSDPKELLDSEKEV